MKTYNEEERLTLQLFLSIFVVIFGLGLLTVGVCVPPVGVISNSILIAFGEICTFAGSLIGIDYNYKWKIFKKSNNSN